MVNFRLAPIIGTVFGGLLLTLAFAWWHADRQGRLIRELQVEAAMAKDEIKAQHKRYAALARTLENQRRKLQTVQAETAHTTGATIQALEAHKSWSDTDVPDDVQKALGGAKNRLPEPSDTAVDGVLDVQP